MLTVVLRTAIIYIFLTLVLRLMGKRQVGELEVSELVSALLLSEIATMAIDDADEPLLYALIPILCILFLEVIVSFGATKLPFIKKIFAGRPSLLIVRGKLDQKELGRMRISLEELMGELRLKGAATLAEVDYAIMEQNGQLSVILKKDKQPLTPGDINMTGTATGIDHALVVDGVVNESVCRKVGRNRQFILKTAKEQGCKLEDIFLLTVDDEGQTMLIKKDGELS